MRMPRIKSSQEFSRSYMTPDIKAYKLYDKQKVKINIRINFYKL